MLRRQIDTCYLLSWWTKDFKWKLAGLKKAAAEGNREAQKATGIDPDAPKCPDCGSPIIKRKGSKGVFYGCSSGYGRGDRFLEWKGLFMKGDYDRGVELAKKALELAEKNAGPNHPDVATSLNNLAALLALAD